MVVQVPDVTTILGEFSYYSHGKALYCTNDRHLYIALSESDDNQVHVYNSYTKDKKKFSLGSLKFRKEDKWGNYIKGVFFQLNEMGVALKPYNITIDGPVLKDGNANLAAVMSVGICFALNEDLKLTMDIKEMALLCHKSCIQYCGELYKFGVINAILNARKGKFMFFDMSSLALSYLDNPFDKGICCFLNVDCRIPQVAMREEIIHRHVDVREAFTRLKAASPRLSFKDFPISELSDRIIPLDEEARKLCTVVLEEGSATHLMARLFPAHDYVMIGKTLGRIGVMIRDDMDLTCPEVDWLIKRSSEIPGCHGAFTVLNGDNTFVGMVIQMEAIDKFKAKLDDYERIFGFKVLFSCISPQGPCCIV